jgi:hypothetical protein
MFVLSAVGVMRIKEEWFVCLSESEVYFLVFSCMLSILFNFLWLFRLTIESFIQSPLCNLHVVTFFFDVDQEHVVGQYLIEYLKCDNKV